MGLIKDGKVSGNIPKEKAFAVHYPGYPSSITRAIETLGGTDAILKARGSQSNKLELYFRPEDPYSHPVSGQLRLCNNLLLRISKRNKKKKQHSLTPSSDPCHCGNEPRNEPQSQIELTADIVARIPDAYHFEGMADYQHVVAVHADAARKKKRNWTEMEEPPLEKAGLIDLDHKDLMLILPPLFSLKDMPKNLVLRPPSSALKKKLEETVEGQIFEMNIEPALAIDFNVKGIPKEIDWRQCIPQGSEMWRWQMVVSELFDERPIWHKDSVIECLLDKGLKFSHQMLKRLLLAVAYYFSGGPFLRLWIRKGYDPRKDSNSRMYQRIDFRVAPPLRNYCDANAAKGLKHRWADLCRFQVFPYKCHTSFQLYELDDDYIQEEIRKPSNQTSCSYATGWFSQHVHDSLRLRVMVRFLSLYPAAGAKRFLRAASDKFEKLKRACFHKGASKSDQQQDQQTQKANEEVADDDFNDNQPDDGDPEVEETEGDEHEEELDPEELDPEGANQGLDLDAEEDGISLQSPTYMENNSRSYLQELFDSFPSTEAAGGKSLDAGSSEEEYQIYEQDDDESYLDD